MDKNVSHKRIVLLENGDDIYIIKRHYMNKVIEYIAAEKY